MGIVYKAEDTKLERPVALKFLAAHAIEDPEHKARFVREAKAAARLDHPNICSVYEIDEAEGQTFLAMAYLEGQTVKDKIAERPLKLDEALDIAVQTAQGLQAAHEKDIVHRDIKSANLMVTPQDQVKIMDFGPGAACRSLQAHRDDHDSRNSLLHVSGTSGGGQDRSAHRSLVAGSCAVRDGHRPSAVQGGTPRGNSVRDHQ